MSAVPVRVTIYLPQPVWDRLGTADDEANPIAESARQAKTILAKPTHLPPSVVTVSPQPGHVRTVDVDAPRSVLAALVATEMRERQAAELQGVATLLARAALLAGMPKLGVRVRFRLPATDGARPAFVAAFVVCPECGRLHADTPIGCTSCHRA